VTNVGIGNPALTKALALDMDEVRREIAAEQAKQTNRPNDPTI
jgi:hypothetical protein